MNRRFRFHHSSFRLQLHHRINPIVITIIIGAIIFASYFLFSHDEAPVNHQTSNVKVSQQSSSPQRHRPQQTKKPQSKPRLKLRSSQKLRKSDLVRVQKILNSFHLSAHQKFNLIKTYQKLNSHQQRHILKLINQGQHHFKNSQTELRTLERYLKSKNHNITSDLNRKRL